MQNKKYTRSVAVNMVIANMIGTGIFVSLGYQVLPITMGGIPDPFAIMVIWLLGGIISLCGATVYGEIATTIKKSGGEYAFLSDLYNPLMGFVSGWISIIVGFSAAIALLALAAGEYFVPLLGMSAKDLVGGVYIIKVIGTAMILLVVIVHVRGIKFGGSFQNYLTYLKLALIAVFLIFPFLFIGNYHPAVVDFAPSESSWNTIFSGSFASALVWVFFAYSGWNASAYIVGSLENPKKNLPFSLVVGTVIVTVIYMLMNFVFMYVAEFHELQGKPDLGYIVAKKVLGPEMGLIFSAVFSIALLSGLSAMFIAAPRVVQEMGKDHKLFKVLGKQSESGAPVLAIMTIMVLSVTMVFFSSFKDIIQYVGITLSFFAMLTVFGVFILRARKQHDEDTVKSWGYPVTPIIFIIFSLGMIVSFVWSDPWKIAWSVGTMIPAVIIYYISKRAEK
ncbi:MAG: amino acid permease [Crocinitomicaceae bacterium]|nr:amino acid permease [Crocinitomicaceae bacterium]